MLLEDEHFCLPTGELPADINDARGDAVARIVRSLDGGPLRRIITGRRNIPTGNFPSVKAGYRSMPWESKRCERKVLELCEVAAGVATLLAQPHRLEMYLMGRRKPSIYFPDLELKVDRQFIRDLKSGITFADACLQPRSLKFPPESCETLVIEVKDDGDTRVGEPEYDNKLEQAAAVYDMLGYHFMIITRTRDFPPRPTELAHVIALDQFSAVSPAEETLVSRLLEAKGGVCNLGRLRAVVHQQKLSTLQIHRTISIDLRERLSDRTCVRLLQEA